MSRTTSIVSTTRTSERSLQVDLWMIVTLGAVISVVEQIVRWL